MSVLKLIAGPPCIIFVLSLLPSAGQTYLSGTINQFVYECLWCDAGRSRNLIFCTIDISTSLLGWIIRSVKSKRNVINQKKKSVKNFCVICWTFIWSLLNLVNWYLIAANFMYLTIKNVWKYFYTHVILSRRHIEILNSNQHLTLLDCVLCYSLVQMFLT